MAHLKDLLVAGPSRFIGEVAFNDNVTFNNSVTLNETLILAKNPQDAEGTSEAYPALIIGDNGNAGAHLAIDQNEIMSKSDIDSPGTLYINNNGGDVSFGGNVIPKATNTLDLGTSSVKWRTLYVGDGSASSSTTSGNIQVNGGIGVSANSYFNADVKADTFTIKNKDAKSHITFSRTNYNYITAPVGGSIAFDVVGGGGASAPCDLVVTDGEIIPGTSKETNIGSSSKQWNTVYSNNIILSSTTNSSQTQASTPAIRIGASDSAIHLIIDRDSINAKATSTTTGALGINESGGLVTIGPGGLTVKGNTQLGDASSDSHKVYGVLNLGGGTAYKIDASANAILKSATIGDGVDSSSTTTGDLKVNGGAGIGKNVWVGGQLNAKTVKVDNSVYFQYNSTDKCLDVIFG